MLYIKSCRHGESISGNPRKGKSDETLTPGRHRRREILPAKATDNFRLMRMFYIKTVVC